MNENTIIKIEKLKKVFAGGNEPLVIFDNTNLEIKKGEKVAIVGPSGSGKSTLLSLLAGLDKPTSGNIFVKGMKVNGLSENELSKYRNKEVAIIFQSFELISPFNAIENVRAPLDIRGGVSYDSISTTANTLLEEVGLIKRKFSFPNTLSGGEKQRVAIARALASDTDIILADEPTGSLDGKTGELILDLLLKEVDKRSKTLIVITHDLRIAERMDRIIELKDRNLHEIKRD
jgi:predicted ABC-type transport system involved in lysophospholipase L1 biosynthesis ATPase subunit